MNCFCRMVDRRKAFSLSSSWENSQRFSSTQISDMDRCSQSVSTKALKVQRELLLRRTSRGRWQFCSLHSPFSYAIGSKAIKHFSLSIDSRTISKILGAERTASKYSALPYFSVSM